MKITRLHHLTLSEIEIIGKQYTQNLYNYHQNSECKETVEHIEDTYFKCDHTRPQIISNVCNQSLHIIRPYFKYEISHNNIERVKQFWNFFKSDECFLQYNFAFVSLAADNNCLELIKFFVEEDKAKNNTHGLSYVVYPAFLIACEKGYVQLVDYFINQQVVIDDTVICGAIEHNQVAILKILLDNDGIYHEGNFNRSLKKAADLGFSGMILYALDELKIEPSVLLSTNNKDSIDFIDNYLNKQQLKHTLHQDLNNDYDEQNYDEQKTYQRTKI
jgi:hypothetical protein